MPFDPFGIEAHHRRVRERIAAGEEGLAQSEVGTVRVSYEVGGSITHGGWLDLKLNEILDEIIVDVAREEGIAGPRTFLRSRITYMIEDRRDYPPHWKKKRKEADDIEAFYLRGAGAPLLR